MGYTPCLTLIPGEATLAIVLDAPDAAYNDEITAREDLLAGLTLPMTSTDTGSEAPGVTLQPVDEPAAQDLTELVESVAADVDAYWAESLAADGTAYTSPGLVVFDTPISTGCGDAAPGQGGSFYCPLDETIYIDGPDLSAKLQGYGVGAALALVAHEWGHHIQQQLDLVESPSVALSLNGMTTLETELQADCFAGSWLYAADAAGQLGPCMLEGVIVLVAETLGDPVDASTLDPQMQYGRQHGSGALRTWWL